jgi:hypothetical protein
VIATIDNSIITELDLKKEIEYIKFINKSEIDNNSEKVRRNIIETLIDRKIKKIEIDKAKIEITEKEIENYTYNYTTNREKLFKKSYNCRNGMDEINQRNI